jgi:BirA family biotin operon repressor/biotin-[acetyl-CoA-carboxylase] ligase
MSDTSPNQPDTLDIAALHAALAGVRLGHPLIYFPTLDSTNTYAVEQARAGAAEGTLVTTDDQTAGRGRVGRAWRSLPGQQLALSVILRPRFPPHFLVMAASLAVAEAIEGVTGLRADIKWPNDVQVAARKVCGILIETGADFAVVGIGVNVNGSLADDPELATRAMTLEDATRHPLSRETLAEEIVRALDVHYAALQAEGEPAPRALRDAWRARLVTLGQRVSLRQGTDAVAGLAEDVNEDGGLLLRRDDGAVQTVTWGDVEAIGQQ